MQEWVREELRFLGMTDAQIHEMEQRSEGINAHLKRGEVLWFKDTRTQEIVFHWAHYDDCHEVWVPFDKRFPAREYISEWDLRQQYRLTPKQRQQLGPSAMSAQRANDRGKLVPTEWWTRAAVEAVLPPKPNTQEPNTQGELF
jgi:hypothetical protein